MLIFNCDTRQGRAYVDSILPKIISNMEMAKNPVERIPYGVSVAPKFLEEIAPPLMANKLRPKSF